MASTRVDEAAEVSGGGNRWVKAPKVVGSFDNDQGEALVRIPRTRPGRSATGFPWSLLGHYLTMDR